MWGRTWPHQPWILGTACRTHNRQHPTRERAGGKRPRWRRWRARPTLPGPPGREWATRQTDLGSGTVSKRQRPGAQIWAPHRTHARRRLTLQRGRPLFKRGVRLAGSCGRHFYRRRSTSLTGRHGAAPVQRDSQTHQRAPRKDGICGDGRCWRCEDAGLHDRDQPRRSTSASCHYSISRSEGGGGGAFGAGGPTPLSAAS